jgi:hypothetical protein
MTYGIGECPKVTDPSTGQRAEKNIFYPAADADPSGVGSTDPDNEQSMYQAKSFQALQSRGVQYVVSFAGTSSLNRRKKS